MNFESCLEVANSEKWTIVEIDKPDKVIFETNFSWRSWGELVTIIFEKNHILVNSRPSPYKKTSIATLGKNTINIDIIRAAIDGS